MVSEIVLDTIKEVYPRYYPWGVVEFFIAYHLTDNILKSIMLGEVWLIEDKGQIVGTGSVKDAEIGRVFILPQFQGNGYGKLLMSELEKIVSITYEEAVVDASLIGYQFYLNRGYTTNQYHTKRVKNQDVLCYFSMSRSLNNG